MITNKYAELTNVAEICNAWNIGPILSTRIPPSGTIHHITLISTDKISYALRAYKYTQENRWRIVCEHNISSYVSAYGLPAISPIPLANGSGETILEYAGRFYALFPFAQGEQISQEQVTSPTVIAAMGQCLGELHRVLAEYPHDKVRQYALSVDPHATLDTIEKITSAITEKAVTDDFDQHVLTTLQQRKEWLLDAHAAVDLKELASLPQQAIHGDYNATNLFFREGRVSGIIDWDQAYIGSRSWEILRTLDYVFHMDMTCSQLFLQAYHTVFPLSLDELETTAKAYGWVQANNLWIYTSYYLEHNYRVRDFIPTNASFTPFNETWASITPSL